MSEILISDNMKKESRKCIFLIILCWAFAIVIPIAFANENKHPESIFYFTLGLMGLYLFIYELTYKLIITNEKIILRVFFIKKELDMTDIINYTCKKYKKSLFYFFRLYTKKKSLLVKTRYKEEFIKILEGNNIKEKEVKEKKQKESIKKEINIKRIKFFSNIIFGATLISPMFSFVIACLIGEVNIFGMAGSIRYFWIMWLFIPLGVLSIIIAIKLKQNKQEYKKNYIVAIICIPLLIIFGSFRFLSSDISYDADKLNYTAKITKLELPKQVKIANIDLESYTVSYLKIIDEKEKNNFEYKLEKDALWQKNLSSKIKSLLPIDIQYELENFDYFVFYNLTLDEYNTYPLDGEYDCIFIAYNSKLKKIIILNNLKINLN